MTRLVYRVDRHFQLHQADISPGLLHGYGVFTTFRVEADDSVFCMESHFNRLKRDSGFFGLTCPWESFEAFAGFVRHAIEQANLRAKVVRITLTAKAMPNPGSIDCIESDVLLSVRPLPAMDQPVRACIQRFDRLFPHQKHINHLAELRYLQDARTRGYDEFIRISTKGYLTEAAYANLFLVTADNVLLTPAWQEAGCLPGIMHSTVITACQQMNIPVCEGLYLQDKLKDVKGVFFTNAVRGLYPISGVDDMAYDVAAIKPLLSQIRGALQNAYETSSLSK